MIYVEVHITIICLSSTLLVMLLAMLNLLWYLVIYFSSESYPKSLFGIIWSYQSSVILRHLENIYLISEVSFDWSAYCKATSREITSFIPCTSNSINSIWLLAKIKLKYFLRPTLLKKYSLFCWDPLNRLLMHNIKSARFISPDSSC